MAVYYMYIVRCSDDTYYTGIARDVNRRLEEHNNSTLGAKYTRSRRPVTLVFKKRFYSRSKAAREEARVKALSRAEKMKLFGDLG